MRRPSPLSIHHGVRVGGLVGGADRSCRRQLLGASCDMADDELIKEPDETFPLYWASVEPAAQLAFGIWAGHPELAWAKTAFGYLPGGGLSPSNDAINEHVAIFREKRPPRPPLRKNGGGIGQKFTRQP